MIREREREREKERGEEYRLKQVHYIKTAIARNENRERERKYVCK